MKPAIKSVGFMPFVIKEHLVPRGRITLPGDKSIAHRALIISALSRGKTIIKNFPVSGDLLATAAALSALGVKVSCGNKQVLVQGRSLCGLLEPKKPLFVADSGTTIRLLLGALAGQDFTATLTAGKYLSARPMARVNIPLRMMGACITAKKKDGDEYPPIVISGNKLKGISYRLPVASAQVKGALLLAGLYAKGKTRVIEPVRTRDHTERMLKAFGAGITVSGNSIILNPGRDLISPGEIYIPGDISSAAFFLVLASIIPGSNVIIRSVGLNPGRSGIVNVLKRMGAKIKAVYPKNGPGGFEPAADLAVTGSRLKAAVVSPNEIPTLVDELPVLMVAACFTRGRTVIKGAGELRVKETDRINSMSWNLKRMGADIRVLKSGARESIVINGIGRLRGAKLKSFGDHRTAMSMVVAALAAEGRSEIDDVSCINKSFPGFIATLNTLLK
ncbi:MAG: 3-phosphoshikimate 1-carboxyvinyltransferase [Candidatus Omnitrophica bacterium]|nr:3-phosphoshikimate 1-carboxyvinyltransferase [Candidatus Omnitrophota bacterium]